MLSGLLLMDMQRHVRTSQQSSYTIMPIMWKDHQKGSFLNDVSTYQDRTLVQFCPSCRKTIRVTIFLSRNVRSSGQDARSFLPSMQKDRQKDVFWTPWVGLIKTKLTQFLPLVCTHGERLKIKAYNLYDSFKQLLSHLLLMEMQR